MRRLGVLIAAAVLLTVAAAGCSSSSGGGASASKVSFDTARADDLAHAAMLLPAELPGTGWFLDKDDDFTTADLPAAKQCDNYNSFRQDAAKAALGKAKRDITMPVGDLNESVDVGLTMNIYDSADRVSGFLKRYKAMTGDIRSCLEQGLQSTLGPASGASVTNVPSLAKSNSVDVPLSFDIQVKAFNVKLHGELHVITMGNAELAISVFGPTDMVTADIVNGTIDKFTQAAEDAAAGKRQKAPAH